MNVFAEITDRQQPQCMAGIRQQLADEDLMRHRMLKRCASIPITPQTFATACQIAHNARHAGANPEQALQAGVIYATRHQLRRPLDDGPRPHAA